MADIWLCLEGDAPTPHTLHGPPYSLPVDECVRLLGLAHEQYHSDTGPHFAKKTPVSDAGGAQHVVIEVAEGEAPGWRAGFYWPRHLHPDDVKKRLGRPAA
jgi:hypothetical protein